jgi:hypothetical protein
MAITGLVELCQNGYEPVMLVLRRASSVGGARTTPNGTEAS